MQGHKRLQSPPPWLPLTGLLAGIARPSWLPLTRELSPQATEGENLQPVCSAHPVSQQARLISPSVKPFGLATSLVRGRQDLRGTGDERHIPAPWLPLRGLPAGIAQPTWLPLTRELSPQAAEGENLQPVCSAYPCLLHQFLFYFQINFFANSAKPPIYFCIADPHYIYFHFFQIGCPNSVFLFLLRSIMFSSVQFDGKTCFCAVEIHDIIANGFLPLKTDRVIS